MSHRGDLINSNKLIAASLLGISVGLLTLAVAFSDRFSQHDVLFQVALGLIIAAIYIFALAILIFDSASISIANGEDVDAERKYNIGNRLLLLALLVLLVEPALVTLVLGYKILAFICLASLGVLMISYYFRRFS